MNLEELVRAALAKEASAEPEEAGAYDRFLRHRRRRAWRAAGSAGLAVALVLALVGGGAWLLGVRDAGSVTGPAATGPSTTGPAATGMVRHPAQGFALTVPPGWKVDRTYPGIKMLTLVPVRPVPRGRMHITIQTTVEDPLRYPGRPGTRRDRELLPVTQGMGGLVGRRSEGRRADGRPFAVGFQRGLVVYRLAWPYHCPERGPCPPAARWRVLQIYAMGEGAGWPRVQPVARRLVETVQPITNALPGGPFQPEEPELFAEPLRTLASGGQGEYAWKATGGRQSAPGEGYWVVVVFHEVRWPNGRKGLGGNVGVEGLSAIVDCAPRAAVAYGAAPTGVASVRVELAGRPAVTVPTSVRDQNLPFSFWALAPIPQNVRVRSVVGLDAAGRRVGGPAELYGVPGAVCRPGQTSP